MRRTTTQRRRVPVGSRHRIPAAALLLLLAASGSLRAPSTARAGEASALPGGRSGAGDTVRLVDDRGDTLRLDAPASRIVSLIPAATELLFAMGAGDRVVGRTRYGVHPPAAREVPSVGEGIRPSVEAIVARRPDAVVVYAGSSNRRSLSRLRDLSVPLLALEHDDLADLRRNAVRLGRLAGRRAAADSLLAAVEAGLDRVSVIAGRRPPRSVYYEVWSDPPITVGAGSYLDSLLTLAGGRNVFDDLPAPSPQVGLEAIIAREPEVLVVAREAGAGNPGTPPAERPGWEGVRAVREGRIRQVDGDLVHRLGPRVAEAAAALAAAVHPELVEELRGAGFSVPGGGG